MRKLVPVFIAFLLLIASVAIVNAQTSIHNIDLPKTLVFQWKINAEAVHPSWKNEDFSITRDDAGLTILYGTYVSLEDALLHAPQLPENAEKATLLAFVNQRSILLDEALLQCYPKQIISTHYSNPKEEFLVRFAVDLGEFSEPIVEENLPLEVAELGFQVTSDRKLAYSTAKYWAEQEAFEISEKLKKLGFEQAKISAYLHDTRLAANELEEIYAYLAYAAN